MLLATEALPFVVLQFFDKRSQAAQAVLKTSYPDEDEPEQQRIPFFLLGVNVSPNLAIC